MNAGPAHAARVEPPSLTARSAAPPGPDPGPSTEAGPVGMPLYAMGAGGAGTAAGAAGAGHAANASTIAAAKGPTALGGLPMYAAAGPRPSGQVVPLPTAGAAAAHGATLGEAAHEDAVADGDLEPTANEHRLPARHRRAKRSEARQPHGPGKAAPDKTHPALKGEGMAGTGASAAAGHKAEAGAKPAPPLAAAQGAVMAPLGGASAKPAAPVAATATAGAGIGTIGASLGGGGGGASAGGAATESAGGGEGAAVAGGEAWQAAAGEEAHDRMDPAEQPARGEAAEAGGDAGGAAGDGSAAAGTSAESSADAAAESAEAAPESNPEASAEAGAASGVVPDPGEAERTQASEEAQDTQEQHRDAAEAQSDERASEQSAQHAETGDTGTATADLGAASGGAEIGGGERDAGLASLGESVGGGGGGDAGGGAGGGGGGTPIPEPEPAPDTASGDPAAGLASASTLQPMQAATALGGVGSAIANTVQDEGAALQSQMPEVEVGSDDAGGTAVVEVPGGEAPAAVPRAEAGASQPTPEAEPQPEPGPAPTAAIPTPFVSDGENGTVNREQASEVQGSVSAMPTTDPELDTSAGAPPPLAKTGDADPAHMQEQRGHLDTTIAEQRAKGAADAALPAGERDVRDRTPRERLVAPKVAAGGGAGAAGVAVPDDESLGIVAESQKGGEVRAAMAQAQGDMAGKRAEHDKSVGEEKDKSDAELARLKADNRADQQAEKAKVQAEVGHARADWSAEQTAEVAKTNVKAKGEITKGNQGIAKEETQGNTEATKALNQGEAEAVAEKQKAERGAALKKRQAEKEQAEDSGGIFGWIASKVSSFFNALKNAITAVFDLAKRAVKWAIDKAKKAAVWAIEKARSAIVGLIRAVGAALIALGDVLLAAFPGLKKKWRSFIEGKVKAAENAVNRLADALKKGVTKLLDALGKAFEFLLDAYKKAMLFVLDAAKGVVMGAINAAKAIAQLLGTFVVLIKDIARAPGEWLGKLGAAAVDGIKNHLWTAFKTAVKEWFNGKLEETLGIGLTIWNVLKKGGITIKEVGHMAFEALKEAIPPALIQLLVEKLVAMIVPAAGAVMAIIEGLQAAWGTVQKIIAAIGKFVAFLKAVKSGGAGPSFAEMLASAAIVVIDFVANWLLKRLRKPAGKVAGKVKAIAQKILAKVKGALKKVGGALKKAGGWVKGKFKAGKKKVGDWWAKKKAKRQSKRDAKHAAKDGKPDHAKKKQDKDAANAAKLRRAVEALRPQLQRMVASGKVSGVLVSARLLFWRARYGLSRLSLQSSGGDPQVIAQVNPSDTVISFVRKHGGALRKIIYDAARDVFARPDVQRAMAKHAAAMGAGAGASADKPLQIETAAESVGLAGVLKDRRDKGSTHVAFPGGGTAAVDRQGQFARRGVTTDLTAGEQHVRKGGAYEDHPQMFIDTASREGKSTASLQSLGNVTLLGGAGPHQSAGARDFAAQQALLKVVEMSRSGQAAVVSMEHAQNVGRSAITHSEGVRADPMTAGGAVGRSNALEKRTEKFANKHGLAPGDIKTTDKHMQRMIEQQIQFIASVMQARYGAENVMFRDEHGLTEAVRQDVQKAVKAITEQNLGLPSLDG